MGLSSEESFTEMFREQYPAVRAFAASLTSAVDVDDVVAETFAVAWRRRDDLPVEWVRGWLLGTARNVVRNDRRRGRRADRFVARLPWLQPTTPRDLAVDVAELDALRVALASLSEADQEVLVLAGWFELSPDELAVALGVTANAATVRLHRARTRLRDAAAQGSDDEVAS
ncbi:MAG: sigma-70 family RNA polymerase sigma factor [Ilumatobacteraceae bacterium]